MLSVALNCVVAVVFFILGIAAFDLIGYAAGRLYFDRHAKGRGQGAASTAKRE